MRLRICLGLIAGLAAMSLFGATRAAPALPISFPTLPGTSQTTRPAYMPDPALSPGVVNPALTKEVLTAKGFTTKAFRHTSGALKAKVYAKYGIKSHKSGEYEIDHIISLELGGADVEGNLFPQPYHGAWNAHIKDELENYLSREMKAGRIPLEVAQKEISTDWVACYRKHIGDPVHNKQWPKGVAVP